MEYKIPPLPTTLGEILQILSREAPAPNDNRLVAIIEKDPAISLYLLRQVNSAYYGLRRQVTEIQRAVSLLGLKQVCNLVLAAALKQTFSYLEDTAARTIYEHVIKTSVATAAFARDLSAHLRLPLAETAFTAGLLHQLGRLVFLYSVPHLYVPLWTNGVPRHAPDPPSLETEQAQFNTDFLRLGASTLSDWGLPEEIVLITKRLRRPCETSDGPLRSLTLTVAVGSLAADGLFKPPPPEEADASDALPAALQALGETHHADAEALKRFLAERDEPIRRFAQSVLSDA